MKKPRNLRKKTGEFKVLAKRPVAMLVMLAVVTAVTGVGIYLLTSSRAATRDPFVWPFASTSPWNMPIGSNAQYGAETNPETVQIRSAGIGLNSSGWSHPVYLAKPTDPLKTFYRTGSAPCDTRSGSWAKVNWQLGGANPIPVPAGAVPAAAPGNPYSGPGDAHFHIVSPDKRYVYENWSTCLHGTGNVSARHSVQVDLHSDGIAKGGVRAYGGSAIGGLIRTWDLEQGTIRHALAFAIGHNRMENGPVWPATSQDGGCCVNPGYTGAINYGRLFAIRPGVNLNNLGLSRGGMILGKALQDYGTYLVDGTGATGGMKWYAEPGAEQNAATKAILAEMRQDLNKLQDLLVPITNNGPNSVGGGGVPRQPLAPPLGDAIASPTPTPTPTPASAASQIGQQGNLATGQTVTASSAITGSAAANVVDGNETGDTARWLSDPTDPQWLQVDLGSNQVVGKLDLLWTGNTTKDYQLQTSTDGANFTTVATGVTDNQLTTLRSHAISNVTARYVRITGTTRWTAGVGHSVRELGIYAGVAIAKTGDANADGQVNITDLNLTLGHWGRTDRSSGDLNQDGKVDILDFNLVLSNWAK